MSDCLACCCLEQFWSTRKLSLHAFEHTPLFSNVEEEFGNGSSFELPKRVEKQIWLTLTFFWFKCESDGPLRELCFSQSVPAQAARSR